MHYHDGTQASPYDGTRASPWLATEDCHQSCDHCGTPDSRNGPLPGFMSFDRKNHGLLPNLPPKSERYPVSRIDFQSDEIGKEDPVANVTGQQFELYDFIEKRPSHLKSEKPLCQ